MEGKEQTRGERLNNIYSGNSSMKFALHLIGSYSMGKAVVLMEFSTEQSKKKECSLCHAKLIDGESIRRRLRSDNSLTNEYIEHLKDELKGEIESSNPIHKVTEGRALAWTGKKTTTTLCFQCVSAVNVFMCNKVIRRDKRISWLAEQISKD
jgi:RNase P subunit RPR2